MPIPTDVIPLGTGSAMPTRGRHLSATAVRREGRLLLFDCGEGTQYRLLEAGLKRSRLDAVFVTHFHGDHLYGLPGLITTMALLGRKDPLTLVGPAGLERVICALPGLANDWLPFETRFVELDEGFEHAVVYEDAVWRVEARPLAHRIFAAGYRLEQKPRPGRIDAARAAALGITEHRQFRALRQGRAVAVGGRTIAPSDVVGPPRPGVSFAYCLDTMPCPGAVELARGVDLLLHEATFADDLADRAEETAHSTARQAAETARAAGAGRLLLTHFSARYASPDALVEEARRVFPNTEAARELERYRLSPAD